MLATTALLGAKKIWPYGIVRLFEFNSSNTVLESVNAEAVTVEPHLNPAADLWYTDFGKFNTTCFRASLRAQHTTFAVTDLISALPLTAEEVGSQYSLTLWVKYDYESTLQMCTDIWRLVVKYGKLEITFRLDQHTNGLMIPGCNIKNTTDGSTKLCSAYSGTLLEDTWYFINITVDNGVAKWYINGVQVAGAPTGFPALQTGATTNALAIGTYRGSTINTNELWVDFDNIAIHKGIFPNIVPTAPF